jgi:hypothetical protein
MLIVKKVANLIAKKKGSRQEENRKSIKKVCT